MKTFPHFVKTGALAGFHCGMTYREASDVIEGMIEHPNDPARGVAPTDLQPPGAYGSSAIKSLKAGPLELMFHRDGRDSEPTLVAMFHRARDPISPDASTAWAIDQFRTWIETQGVRVVGGAIHGKSPHLTLESGVRVEFDDQGLTGARYSPERAPEFKQVTINLTTADLQRIEREAKAAGTSIAKICSEWIRERASMLKRPAESGVS